MNEGSKTPAAELVSLRKKLAGKNHLSSFISSFMNWYHIDFSTTVRIRIFYRKSLRLLKISSGASFSLWLLWWSCFYCDFNIGNTANVFSLSHFRSMFCPNQMFFPSLENNVRDHSCSTYAKYFEKPTFLTPRHAHDFVCIRGKC